jgi:hypothetical protein
MSEAQYCFEQAELGLEEPRYNRGVVDAEPVAVALALARLPAGYHRLRLIVRGEASLSSSVGRTIPQTLAILNRIPGIVARDRRGSRWQRVLVLRTRCVLHEECGTSLEMAQRCAEYEYSRDPEAWLKATLAVGRRRVG